MNNLEKFLSLPIEKQNYIIDAALNNFGRNGYKKASVNDIAMAAGISKAMVFYYFGCKRSMYLYLAELCGNIIISEIEKKLDKNIVDFFDRIKMVSEIKISVIKQHPATLLFMKSVYNETDEEVSSDIKSFFSRGDTARWDFIFDGINISNLKEDIDPNLLLKFLIWAAEGFSNELPLEANINDIDAYMKDFFDCLDIMKKYFNKN